MAENKEDKQEEVVSVKKSVLDKIIKTQQDQEEELKVLRNVADKSRMYLWEKDHKAPESRIVRISVYKGKVVVGWKMVIDEMYSDANGIWHEKQIVEIITEDDKKETLTYIDFTRLINKVEAEVLERTTDEKSGNVVFKVKTKEGKEYSIDSVFIN